MIIRSLATTVRTRQPLSHRPLDTYNGVRCKRARMKRPDVAFGISPPPAVLLAVDRERWRIAQRAGKRNLDQDVLMIDRRQQVFDLTGLPVSDARALRERLIQGGARPSQPPRWR